ARAESVSDGSRGVADASGSDVHQQAASTTGQPPSSSRRFDHAFDAFLKLDGVQGEASDSKHMDEIEVLSFHWGASQPSSFGTGSGSGRVHLDNFHFYKKVDKASAVLWQKCCTGEHIDYGLLVVRKAGGTQLEYLKVKLTKCIVSSVQFGASGSSDEIPTESI